MVLTCHPHQYRFIRIGFDTPNMRSKTPKRTIPKVGPWPCACDGHRVHRRHFAGMVPEKGAVIRSPLAVTVGHGLTGPPCPVGESVPCSSGLLLPRLRMTGRKRCPFWMDSLTRTPVWGVRFPGSYNRQGLPRRSCSHACCGHGMEMFTRSPVRTRSPLLTLAHPPWGVPLAAVVAVACFLNRRGPVLRLCDAHPATVRGRTPRDVSGK